MYNKYIPKQTKEEKMNQVRIVVTFSVIGNRPFYSVVTDEGCVIGGSSDWFVALEIIALMVDEE